jgi:disulfide bond formation protein DsbB
MVLSTLYFLFAESTHYIVSFVITKLLFVEIYDIYFEHLFTFRVCLICYKIRDWTWQLQLYCLILKIFFSLDKLGDKDWSKTEIPFLH